MNRGLTTTRRWSVMAIFVSLLLQLQVASAEVDPKAAQLIMINRYQSAIKLLTSGMAPVEDEQTQLLMGTVFYKDAMLHRELAAASAEVVPRYWQKLAAETGAQRSRYVDLFSGLALLETGQAKPAIATLKKFLSNKNLSGKYQEVARVNLGLAYHLAGHTTQARKLWQRIDSADPEVRAVLAGAYQRAGLVEFKPMELIQTAVLAVGKDAVMSPLVLENALLIYGAANAYDKGLELIRDETVSAPVYVEQIGGDKTLNFYSIALPNRIARIYYLASLHYLQAAQQSNAFRNVAQYYLAAAYLNFEEHDKAVAAVASARSGGALATAFDNRAEIMEVALKQSIDKSSLHTKLISELAHKFNGKPELMAELVTICTDLKLDCTQAMVAAKAEAERSQSERYRLLHSALGFYYLRQGKNAMALSYLETGRDKSMKNKMESNDPLMLVRLAQLYLDEKSFSENLEIYFELGKEYPAVRQIQEAVQGVYAMEFKSAGDVKIF